ncbi:MAG: hypothetical protein AAF615_01935 [Pseudomonadota bacterium]
MRRSIAIAAAIPAAMAVICGAAIPAGAAADETPDLMGTWQKTDGHIIYWNGEVNQWPHAYERALIIIHDQTGPVFKATQVTVPATDAQAGRHGAEALSEDGHTIVGLVGWDNKTVVFADVGDTTEQHCTITSNTRMECMVWEAGTHAIAGRYVIERQDPE